MNYRRLLTIAAIALLLVVGVLIGTYAANFGLALSPDPAVWGQFGDYFGGTLNPILTSISLLATVCVVALQINSMAEARLDRSREVTIDLLRTIEAALDRRLNVNLAPPGAPQPMTMRQLSHEAERLVGEEPKPGSLGQFVTHARASGTVVWAEFREMRDEFLELVAALRRLTALDQDSQSKQGAAVAGYYARKFVRLPALIATVESLAGDDARVLDDLLKPLREDAR